MGKVDVILQQDNIEDIKDHISLMGQFDVDDMGRNLLERAVIKGSYNIVKYLLTINFPVADAQILAKRNAQFLARSNYSKSHKYEQCKIGLPIF